MVQVWPFWKLLSGPSRGFWKLLSGPSLFLAYFIVVSNDCVCTLSYHFVFFLCPIIWHLSKNNLFFFKKRVEYNWGLSIFSVLSLNFENSPVLGLLKHYQNRGFSIFCVFCC